MTALRSKRRQQADEFVPLSERVTVLMSFRTAAAVAIALLQCTLNPAASVLGQWLIVLVYLLASFVLSAPVLTAHRELALRTFGLSLLVDGIFLQSERVIGTPIGLDVMIAAYMVSVCLLASFRTGLKVALWHSLLILILRQAILLGSLDRADYDLRDQSRLLAYLCVLWFIVIATAQFAALNERELRRRRYDAESFRVFASKLASVEYLSDVRELLLEFIQTELDVRRCAWILSNESGFRISLGRGVDESGPSSSVAGSSALLAPEPLQGPARVVYRLDESESWLAGLFPKSRRIIAVPVPTPDLDETHWVVAEHLGRGTRLERRIVSGLSQACAASALAWSRAAAISKLRAAASTDGLTGSANRRTFDDALARLQRSTDEMPVSMLLVDIDKFKQVNDVHGHQVGDAVLQSVAHLLEQTARATDLVARYGGEEFAVVLMRTTTEEAAEVGERMRRRIEEDAVPLKVTISIGVGPAAYRREDVDTLVSRADAALYEAKRGGRNRVIVHDSGVKQLHAADGSSSGSTGPDGWEHKASA